MGKSKTPVADGSAILVRDLKSKGQFVVAYAGAHGLARTPSRKDLIEAARIVKPDQISVVLIGDGLEKKDTCRTSPLAIS